MTKIIQSRRPYHWCAQMLIVAMAIIGYPLQAHAEDLYVDGEMQKAITFSNSSPGVINIRVAICCDYKNNKGKKCWKTIQLNGNGSNIKLRYIPKGKTEPDTCNFLGVWSNNSEGDYHAYYQYYLLNDEMHGSSLMFLNTNGSLTQITDYPPIRQRQSLTETTYVEFEWHYPTHMVGQEVIFYYSGKYECHNEEYKYWPEEYGDKEICRFTIGDDVTLDAYDPVPCTDAGDEGLMMIPVVSSNTIDSLNVYDKKDSLIFTIKADQPGNYMMPKVDATNAYDHLKYEPTIQLSTVYNAPVNSPSKVSGPFTKVIPDSLPMIHKPENLRSQVQGGSIKLTWDVNHLDYKDLLPGDMFQIQRKLPGQTDYKDIDLVIFDDTLSTYEYFDDKAITSVDTIADIKYRIRRAATDYWGWEKNPTVITDSIRIDTVTGFVPKNLTSSLKPNERKVTIKWQDNGGIWDSRGALSLVTYMYNEAGTELRDSLTQAVTDDERRERNIEYTLSRYCVKYKFALRLDKNSSTWLRDTLMVEDADPQYYDNSSFGKIKHKSLTADNLYSSVLLSWDLVDRSKPVDYFEIYRSIRSMNQFEKIATNLTDLQYEDKTVSPTKSYDYYVCSVTDCEDLHISCTDTVPGECVHTGRLEGYVRFADGTGIPGITVTIAPVQTGGPVEVIDTTDESGKFSVDKLRYYGNSTGSYRVMVTSAHITADDLRDDCAGGLAATFTAGPAGNDVRDLTFTVTKGYRISGYVMYDGTSIPVKGVSFLIDGNEVHSANGTVVTDHEGKFSFWTLQGEHKIQAQKTDHSFGNKGTYTGNITQDVAGLYFYDQTRVTLIGRVAGGKDQGDLPLDNSLSRNNLGDNLKIVMELEGDHTSWLVYDNTHPSLTERDEEFKHRDGQQSNHKTRMHTTRHRIEIWPDSTTGEYRVQLPPVAWKIAQITAEGYPTLFQEGKTGDVIDLTDALTEHQDTVSGGFVDCDDKYIYNPVTKYHAQYNRIYHAPVELVYKQLQTIKDSIDYFGEKNYIAQNLAGDKATVPLVYGKNGATCYAFGYPVFSIDRNYQLQLSAQETYYWNNNHNANKKDVVHLSGGTVTVQNQMISSTHRDEITLDEQGQAIYTLQAAQTPYILTGEQALRTVSFTLAIDGTTFEAEPLRAYVLNVYYKPGARDILSIRTPRLVDILRDPPGGTSSAKISKGSTLKYAYQMDMKWAAGASLNITFATGYTSYIGAWAGFGGGMTMTYPQKTSIKYPINLDIVFSGSGQRAFSYTITTTEDITTSSSPLMVGADADVYIGIETNIFAKPAVAIRALPDNMFNQLKGELEAGRMVEIARGKDLDNNDIHLVRDEIVAYGDTVTSVFHHSQQYIIKQLIPELVEQCQSMLFTGSEAEAQAAANTKNEPVYRLKGSIHTTDSQIADGYDTFYPSSWDQDKQNNSQDRLQQHIQAIRTWISFIEQNEREKLNATELVKNFDLDGGSTTSYTEDFTSAYSYSSMTKYPLGTNSGTDGFFGNGGDVALIFGSIGGSILSRMVFGGSLEGHEENGGAEGVVKDHNNVNETETISNTSGGNTETRTVQKKVTQQVTFPVVDISFSIAPVIEYNVNPVHSESHQYNRRESFSISMDPMSHIDFDVYRVKTFADEKYNSKTDDKRTTQQLMDVFTNDNFLKQVDYDQEYLERHFKPQEWQYARSFVYRTRGGATCRPYEGERKTIFYQPGTVLDQATKRIENPIIKMDKQSVSGVPYGEPARFKIYLANESEQPEAAYSYFGLYMDDKSNTHGAKLMLDGMPLTGDLRTVKVVPGEVTQKTLEVYASEDFDYDDLRIGIRSLGDFYTFQEAQFSVHYLRTAGTIAISSPGDKWIMNTDAPTDSRGYYMPVVISGYDMNQKNFDHIEFQYKESTRGDDYWTNLCAYYADKKLYDQASGNKKMIPENGYITTYFYGDGVEMEKAYDLRAVLFVRNGSEYLTSSSKVLTGIKDTRRPRLFGQPEPKNGILEAGDDIIFNFSEAIEHNYLSGITNFEVVGETNENNIQTETSLMFSGTGYAESEARRNFGNKNISVEMLIQPDYNGSDMPLFAHGITSSEGNRLELWLTSERKLKAVVKTKNIDTIYISDRSIGSTGFQHVAMVLDNEKRILRLYNNQLIGQFKTIRYMGTGTLIFGATALKDNKRQYYTGRMLEARVWNRVMDATLFANYVMKHLTGYEMGLIDYYPMDDGYGTKAQDKAQGAHLQLNGATWALPKGMALYLDSEKTSLVDGRQMKGLKLKNKYMSRTEESDYTLMFWFKTDRTDGALISNGSGRKKENNARNCFFIGLESDTLKYRTNGMELNIPGKYSDNAWHHYAMTVDRAHNTANIYVDRVLRQTFRTDNLGGMTGDNFFLGNMVWIDGEKLTEENPLTGYIDEVGVFAQALPFDLIKRYSMKSPLGTEKGLITYLSFSQQERDPQNQIVLQPFVLNKVIHTDMDGNMTDDRDTVFYENHSLLLARVDKNVGAPVQLFKELTNLNFDFVGRDNQLMVNINEQQSRINKRNLYVTVTDIPDMNGNYTASPYTATFFADFNPLRWSEKTIRRQWMSGTTQEIELRIRNTMGKQHTYTIENLPEWISASKTTDIIEPQAEDIVILTVSPDLNVGSYDEIIYLTDEDGLAEPLTLYFTVEGEAPQWAVSKKLMKTSMSITGVVKMSDAILTDTRDIVAAFDSLGICRGIGHIEKTDRTDQPLLYLTLYGNDSIAGSSVTFRLWHYNTGKTMELKASEKIRFQKDTIVGTVKNPVVMTAINTYTQSFHLEPGWNWISFNVYDSNLNKVGNKEWVPSFNWSEGDIVSSKVVTFTYSKEKWSISNSQKNNDTLYTSRLFKVYVNDVIDAEVTGIALKDKKMRTIKVYQGWNEIGYTPMVNLPVNTALADYWRFASDGDIIKSQHEFAIFTQGANGTGEWTGSLRYMKPGEGYILFRKNTSSVNFLYPYVEPGETVDNTPSMAPSRALPFSTTMTMVAQANDLEIEQGDRLVAYSAGQECGEATANDSVFYMSINGDIEAPVSFAIERNGNIFAVANETITYIPDTNSGTPQQPTQLHFVYEDATPDNGLWYSIYGFKLNGTPENKGLYIHNGKKHIIR